MQMRADTKQTRTAEILERVKDVFARKGFEGTTMQDLARAAGMSAGNFYRYFPSKDAIVAAMCELDLDDMRGRFEAIRNAADPVAAFVGTLRHHVMSEVCAEGPLWAEMDAAAFRRAEIAAMQERMRASIIGNLVGFMERISKRTDAAAHEEFALRAELVILMVKGLAKRGAHSAAGEEADRMAALQDFVVREIARIVTAPLPPLPAAPAPCEPLTGSLTDAS